MLKITNKSASSGKLPFLVVFLLIVGLVLFLSSCSSTETPQPMEQVSTPYKVAECLNKNGTISTTLVRADNNLTENWTPGWVWNQEIGMNVTRYVRTK